MSRKRPGTTADIITHLSYIYINYLTTFQFSGWPYGCILTSLKPWAWAEIAESDSELGTNHTTMTRLRPGTTSE